MTLPEMTLPEFKDWSLAQGSVAKYDDGQYRGECVSLINQYCYRVLNVPAGAWGHAKDWGTNAPQRQYFDIVSGPPVAGDILVYGATFGGGFGHIEMALSATQALFQNRNFDRRVGIGPILAGYYAILRIKGGGPMLENPYVNKGDVTNAFRALMGREPTQADLDYVTNTQRPWNRQGNYQGYFYDLLAHPEFKGAEYVKKSLPNDGDITNMLRFCYQDKNYQPTVDELNRYKRPDWGWKKLAYDTIAGAQQKIDKFEAQLAKAPREGAAETTLAKLKTILEEILKGNK